MSNTAQEIYTQVVQALSAGERLRLATLILNGITQQDVSAVEQSNTWTEQDQMDFANFSWQYAASYWVESEDSAE